jgi:hypothetical protein
MVGRVSDLSPEEQAAHWDSVQRALDLADEANARLAERAERREADGSAIEERHAELMRQAGERERMERARAAQQQPQPKPAPVQQTDWSAWNDWADRRACDVLKVYDKGLVEDMHNAFKEAREISRTELKAAIDALRTEIKAEIAAEARIAELERRLEDAERRAAPGAPRQIGWRGSDAA